MPIPTDDQLTARTGRRGLMSRTDLHRATFEYYCASMEISTIVTSCNRESAKEGASEEKGVTVYTKEGVPG